MLPSFHATLRFKPSGKYTCTVLLQVDTAYCHWVLRNACAVDLPRPKTSKPARSLWPAGIRTSTATPDVCVINSLSAACGESLLGEGEDPEQKPINGRCGMPLFR